MRGRRKETFLEMGESEGVAGDMVGDAGSGGVGMAAGQGIGIVGVVVVAAAAAGVRGRDMVMGMGIEVASGRAVDERLGEGHGGGDGVDGEGSCVDGEGGGAVEVEI